MYALDAVDGSVSWRFETLGPVQSHARYDPQTDSLYFGSNDGALYKVGAERGGLKWRFATGAEVSRRVALDRGVVYVVNANDTLIAMNDASGALLWSKHRAPALGVEVAGYAGPLLWRGLVYTSFSDGSVEAFDARSGEGRWGPVDLSADIEQTRGTLTYLDADATPIPGTISGKPVIFVASYEGGVFALDAETGRSVWNNPDVAAVTALTLWLQPRHQSGKGASLVPEQRLLIVSTGTSGLWALDPSTGQEIWHRAVPSGDTSRAVPIAGAVLFSTTRQGLFLLSPPDGQLLDGVHTGGGFFSMAPAAYGRRAFILSNAGTFYSFVISRPIPSRSERGANEACSPDAPRAPRCASPQHT